MKKSRQDRQHRTGRSGGRAQQATWTSMAQELMATQAIGESAEAAFHGMDDADERIGLLVTGASIVGGRNAVARDLHRELEESIRAVADGHWRPGEVVRQVRRGIGARAADITAAMIRQTWHRHGGDGTDPQWADEASTMTAPRWRLDETGATWASDVAVAVKIVGLLSHLPALPECRAGDCSAGQRADTSAKARMLEKVRHLLWKAESTEFPGEADAFTAKAQELLARHSIDGAALGTKDSARRRSSVAVRRIWLENPYLSAKAQLLQAVATANRCRSVITKLEELAVVAGHDDDLDTVETLFTSLLVQATARMTAAGPKTDSFGRSRTRAFRHSFLVAFAVRIGQRLREAGETSVVEGIAAHGDGLLPVLASRSTAADDTIDELFPHLGTYRVSATDSGGWIAGTVAADHAQLGIRPQLAHEVT